jgi:colanic acid biosynthesis glycosyl transferase WcaI
MKILLLTQLFQPEPNFLKGLAFVRELQARGHECEVLTGFPHYPYGKLYSGYRMRPMRQEVLEGVRVTRAAMFPSHDTSTFRRMLTYLSFAVSATLTGLLRYRRSRFDVIHVYQGPATLMLPGKILSLWTGAKLVLDVQDLWPDSVSVSNMVRSRALMRMLGVWVRWTYAAADSIIVLSHGYKEKIVRMGADPEKIHVIFNWSDETDGGTEASMPDKFHTLKQQGKSIVLYAGTMGRVQGLHSVLDAAALLQPLCGDIHFAFVGSGLDAAFLKGYAAERKLSNVSFFPRVEAPLMRSIFAGADVLLIHLKKDGLGSVGIPQKTQAYLAAGKPVIMAANGEAGELMKASNAAICCEPENPVQIADAVRRMFMKTREERQEMGANGVKFYRTMMSFDIGIKHVIETYEAARRGRKSRKQNGQAHTSTQNLGRAHTIHRACEEDIAGIVDVHISSFDHFFLTFLGPRFLKLLYREIINEKGSVAFVAVSPENHVIAFAVGVNNQVSLYRRLAMHRWLAFALASLGTALLHPRIIPRLFEAFAYIGKSRAAACPALLMSIAVGPEGKGKGIGRELVERFIGAMAEEGIDRVCLTTDRDNNERANEFYIKTGFTKVREFQTRQGRWMNEYVIQTTRGQV